MEKLALQGSGHVVIQQWFSNMTIVVIGFFALWAHRRARVERRDWIRLALLALALSIWMTVAWLIGTVWYEWPLILTILLMLAGILLLYFIARPLMNRIEDPDKIRKIFHREK